MPEDEMRFIPVDLGPGEAKKESAKVSIYHRISKLGFSPTSGPTLIGLPEAG